MGVESFDEVMRTTGAVREFTDQPVDEELIYRILDTARFAPSGGNRQAWRVVVVGDPAVRHALRECYLPGWYSYLAQRRAGLVAFSPLNDPSAESAAAAHVPAILEEAAASGGGFAEHLDRVPVLLAVLADLGGLAATDRDLARVGIVGGASIYPFVWSILLAARAEGLGGVMTTMAVCAERDALAALHAGEDEALAALVALGYPRQVPRRLTRRPVEDFATRDRRDGTAFSPARGAS